MSEVLKSKFGDVAKVVGPFKWPVAVILLLFTIGYTINLYTALTGGYPRAESDLLKGLDKYVDIYYVNSKIFPSTYTSTEGPVRVPVEGLLNVIVPQYVRCPDVCHMETYMMLYASERLAEEGLLDRVIFVTVDVDPWRGTLEEAESYIASMTEKAKAKPRWIWVLDSMDRMERLYKQLGLVVQFDKETELIVHTAGFYIVTEKGTLLYYIRITDEGWRNLDKVGEALYLVLKIVAEGGRLPAEILNIGLPGASA